MFIYNNEIYTTDLKKYKMPYCHHSQANPPNLSKYKNYIINDASKTQNYYILSLTDNGDLHIFHFCINIRICQLLYLIKSVRCFGSVSIANCKLRFAYIRNEKLQYSQYNISGSSIISHANCNFRILQIIDLKIKVAKICKISKDKVIILKDANANKYLISLRNNSCDFVSKKQICKNVKSINSIMPVKGNILYSYFTRNIYDIEDLQNYIIITTTNIYCNYARQDILIELPQIATNAIMLEKHTYIIEFGEASSNIAIFDMKNLYIVNGDFSQMHISQKYKYLDGALLAISGCELHLIKFGNTQISDIVLNEEPIVAGIYEVHYNTGDIEVPHIIINPSNGKTEIIFVGKSKERCVQFAESDFDY